MLITIDLLCFDCNARFIDTVPREEATYEARQDCPVCGKLTLGRIPSAPTVLKASWPDGRRSKASQDLREAAKLKVLAADMDSLDRQGISKEISKLEKT